MAENFTESDMYLPIKSFFLEMGYDVKSEVKNCDVALIKNGELTVVELKKSFCAKLLFQALDRQKITPQVYIAIPQPKRGNNKDFTKIKQIVKKLDIGLITVAMFGEVRSIDIVITPPVKFEVKDKRRKNEIIKEAGNRTFDVNSGGSARKKIATAYREKAICAACALEKKSPLFPRDLVSEFGCDKKIAGILNINFYGWFDKLSDKSYELSEVGKKMLNGGEFKEIIDYYREKFDKKNCCTPPDSNRLPEPSEGSALSK